MTQLKPGDRVWISEDRYDDTAPFGFATITKTSTPTNPLVEIQFEPCLVSVDRVHPRPAPGGR